MTDELKQHMEVAVDDLQGIYEDFVSSVVPYAEEQIRTETEMALFRLERSWVSDGVKLGIGLSMAIAVLSQWADKDEND